MIFCKELNASYESKEKLFEALRLNKDAIFAQKKMLTKQADAVNFQVGLLAKGDNVIKSALDNIQDINSINAKLVINTTNIMDSHGDVHLKGIWSKSVKEAKNLLLLQEHKMTFENIISDSVSASVTEMKWTDLGVDFKGSTEALIFDSEISKSRNEFMFNQYAKGFVKEHSVGMRYVKMFLAINSDSKYDVEEKANWDKYIVEVINKEEAEAQGYFWAIAEAKVIEGSAVVKGSNFVTPTLDIEAVKNTSESEPPKGTQSEKSFYSHLI